MTNTDLNRAIECALTAARKALAAGEIPVGACVMTADGTILASAGNRCEQDGTQLGHAELYCLDEASRKTPGRRLNDCALVVTLEPCLMCLGAALNAGISRVYYLVSSPDSGAFTRYDVHARIEEHHLESDEAQKLLTDFFKTLRK